MNLARINDILSFLVDGGFDLMSQKYLSYLVFRLETMQLGQRFLDRRLGNGPEVISNMGLFSASGDPPLDAGSGR